MGSTPVTGKIISFEPFARKGFGNGSRVKFPPRELYRTNGWIGNNEVR